MLAYNEVKERVYIVLEGAPYEVLTSHVFRKQQRKPVNATKLKNLITGKVVEHSFAVSDKVVEAEIAEREATFLYNHRDEFWFCEASDKSKRFKLTLEQVGEKIKFVKANTNVKILLFEEQLIGLKIPVKVELKVKEAAPAVKGNTVQGGSKKVTLETGAEILVPMFVSEGDTVLVNTDTGEYTGRG